MSRDTPHLLKNGERIDYLLCDHLPIIQSQNHFAFSLDALLLADFTTVKKAANQVVVDFCSGNGVIPLLLSQRTKGHIIGIEIQADVCEMAKRSIALNDLSERIDMLTLNLRDVRQHLAHDSVDVITCNPPYFKYYPDSPKNPNHAKALARHEVAMTAQDIFSEAHYLLKTGGKLYMVHQVERLMELMRYAEQHRFALKTMRFVHAKPDRNAHIVLLAFLKNGQQKGLVTMPPLYTQMSDNHYTEEMQAIFHGRQ